MYTAAVLTISDSRAAGGKTDESGPAAEAVLTEWKISCNDRAIVPDEADQIEAAIRDRCGRVNLIITTGGTGIAPRDVTPEAAERVIERSLPGFGEIMRVRTFDLTPLAIVSRSGAGIAAGSLILYLPGSPNGVRDCLTVVRAPILHVLKKLTAPGSDCAVDR